MTPPPDQTLNDIADTAAAQELSNPLPVERQLFSYGMSTIAFGLTALALLPLLAILLAIVTQGFPSLTGQLFTQAYVDGGFANAIQGTGLMVGIASLLSVPMGILTAIYLSEFGKQSTIANAIRFVISILTGVPSIVVGVFAYAVIVYKGVTLFGVELVPKGFSALAGGFALAVIMLPVVTLATEEALKLVPTQQRLASAALGANYFQTTFRIVVGSALPGITTGVLLAVARAAGETAPLIFTALFAQNWLEGLLEPAPSLSVLIYNFYNDPTQLNLVWTASLVLVSLILVLNILSRVITRKRLIRR